MKIVEKPRISGDAWFLIKCDRCEQQFLVAPNEYEANGKIKCEFCPNICRKEDIEGLVVSEESRKNVIVQNPDTGEKINE